MDGEKQQRRSFLAKTVELAAAVPLIGLIIENFRNRTSYYEIDSTAAQMLEQSHPKLDAMINASAPIGSYLDNLSSSYRNAYHKRHVRMVPYTRQVGKSTTVGVRPETYYTWEEPSNVPNHNAIEGWRDFHVNFLNKISRLSQEATIDLERLRELSVVKQRTGRGKEGLVSLAVYTPQIAALLFYEEAIAKIRHGHEEHVSAEELVDRHDTKIQITRRSFFKVGAALAGAFISSPIVYKNRKKREEGKSKLEKEIARMQDLREINEDEAFSQYFGIGPDKIIEQYKNHLGLSEQALQSGVEDNKVRTAFSEFVQASKETVDSLESLISDGVPKEISDLTKSALIAQNLRDKSISEHQAVYTGLGLTGLAVAGTIAFTLIPLEIISEYLANHVERE